MDGTDRASIQAVVDQVIQKHGQHDILIIRGIRKMHV